MTKSHSETGPEKAAALPHATRYYDDVSVGDELPPEEVGPLTTSEVVRFSCSVETFFPLHHDADWARARGWPAILVAGPFRHAILTGLVTTWAGPEAFVRETDISNRGSDFPGGTLRLTGTVSRTWIEEGLGHVEVETELHNDTGQRSCYGRVVVVLPRRGHGHVLKIFEAPEELYSWAFDDDADVA